MINEKDIRRFRHGDKYLKSLLRPQLEDEVNDLTLSLPEYERYCDANPQDALIGTLVRKGRGKLKIITALLRTEQ